MRKTKRLAMIAIVTLAALTLILTFRPKQWVIGGLVGGPLPPYATAYREEYECIGIKLIVLPDCADCGASHPCYGILTERSCSIEEYNPVLGVMRTPVACQDFPDPPEPLPTAGVVTVVVTVIIDPTATPEPFADNSP